MLSRGVRPGRTDAPSILGRAHVQHSLTIGHLLEAQEIARVGSWEWDLATGAVVVSAEQLRLLGEELPPGLRRRVEEEVRAGSRAFAFEHRRERPGGKADVLLVSGRIAFDEAGRPARVVGTAQDVTEQKRREAVLEQFIADAAHELRTPLAAVLGLIELLTERRDELSEEQAGEAFDTLGRAGGRIDVLVRNLLDLTRLRRGVVSVTLEPVPLGVLFEELVAELPSPDGITVEIEADAGPVALTDRSRLHQILANLVTNAYKYGGTTVRLEAAASGDSVLVAVVDDGPGVAEALVPELFEPFRRGEHAPSKAGHGLGLAIVKVLSEACGARVWYEPAQPSGSRFCVLLPTPR